ncbi:GNAT family N-acetyltransferase [Sediminicoccus rosea]|uniref:GNAT family N-acetyltransferase n=1 Tax=Sediminicoccus rosea TaxID=1225128 RepID=A0ABZ0PDY5_9PROT|nr:GNAT family N-acetyltransferase [Sediminicoccus rosea]WPB83822.1 GNAT family N-acetyltransferase [Sediminicoccus rosea]
MTADHPAPPASLEGVSRGAGPGSASIRIFTSMDEAEAMWRAAERSLIHTAFQTYEWLATWVETLGTEVAITPLIVLVEEGERPVMLIPLGRAKRRGIATITFLGGEVTDYHAPLVAADWQDRLAPAGFAPLWTRILAALPRADLLRLGQMPEDILGVPNPFASLPGARPSDVALSLRLPANVEDFRRGLRSNLASDTRRKRRRLAEIGAVEHAVARTPEEMSAAVAAMADRKSRRFLETTGKDPFARPAFRAFYDRMSQRVPGDGAVQASVLRVGGEVVAAHWGVVHRGRFYYLMIGWSAGEWFRYSVGRILIDALIAAAIEDRLEVFDLTIGDEAYKSDWANERLTLLALNLALSPAGRVVLAAEAARHALRERAKRVQWLRALVRRLAGRKPLTDGG